MPHVIPPTSKRQRILEALRERVSAITVPNGYVTEAGRHVFLAEAPPFGPADPPTAICLVVGDDTTTYQGEKISILLPVEIVALANAELDAPWEALEAVLADVKRAVELPERTLGGLVIRHLVRGSTRTLEREPGTSVVGAAVTYVCHYTEVWGKPEY
jgi:hypothetical protein